MLGEPPPVPPIGCYRVCEVTVTGLFNPCVLLCVFAFLGLLISPPFSLLWPSPWGWEEERAPSLFFNRGPVTAPSSGLVASERAVWEPGRVAPSGTATERFPAEVAEVLRSAFSEAGSRVFIFFRKTEHSLGVLGLVFLTTLCFSVGVRTPQGSELLGPVS